MSDARIQELEEKIGDLENNIGIAIQEIEEASDHIVYLRADIIEYECLIEALKHELNHEPFDEAI